MCDVLNIPKSTYYYHAEVCGKRALKTEDNEISKEIARIFKESGNNYGTRKIKKELSKLPEPKHVSRRRIGRLMKGLGLVSNYTVAQYKVHNSTCNEGPIKNELQRQFEQKEPLAVIVSDLTYVRVGTNGIMYAYLSTFSIVKSLAVVLVQIRQQSWFIKH